ncbi:MAG: MEDS domain-containing protein [Nitrospirae bacterium]|uniref:MEDS domain-containing protein n=1 Tax=Candidatus Magnetobacterium casense TaxID=1455061 RepID=UPI0005905562|nr:MEDS domain-containing protein [Candidatus Magnetobacterium casensis]MBF0337426.1 MEDS domain-containing protein [Nitrospirota bacterium]
MATNDYKANYGFTKETFPLGTHICYVYNDNAERRKVMRKFVESGLLAREKVVYLVDVATTDDIDGYLMAMELDVDQARGSGQLVMDTAMRGYCPNGYFDIGRMMQIWKDFYNLSQSEGYAAMRATGETWWTQRGVPGSEHWIEYEAMLNKLVLDYPFSGLICQYDAKMYNGVTIFDVLSVHPLMIVQGQVLRNPYYVQPDEFMAKKGH